MQESPISFRASPELVSALNDAAKRNGVSQSELIRQALEMRFQREQLAEQTAFDPFGRLAAAARGDIDAQRSLANLAVQRIASGDESVDALRTLAEGLVFARLAAAQGGIADQGLCISMLALMVQIGGEEECADDLAEATARVAMAANEGDENAAAMLPGLIDCLSVDAIPAIKDYEKRLQIGGGN